MSYPSLPWVSNPRILGGTLTTNVIKSLKIFNDGILLEDFRLLDNNYDIFFPVSQELWTRYPNMEKIGYPTISKAKVTNQLTFTFMISTRELIPKYIKRRVLGVDPGKTDIFTGMITDKRGVTGPVLGPSVETQRSIKKLKKIDEDIAKKSKRLRNLRTFTDNNGKVTWDILTQNISKLEGELASVRAKRARVVDFIDWNAAVDTVNHARNNNAILSLEKVKFNTGGTQWRNGSYCFKVKHRASKNDVRVVDAPPEYSSQKCHKCQVVGSRVGKLFACTNRGCGWSGDADVNAAVNHSISGQKRVNNRKVVIGKGAPTPRRVKPPKRATPVRTLPVIIEKRDAYYKGVSSEGKRVIIRVILTPFKVKPKGWTFKKVNSSVVNSGTVTP